MNPLGWVVESLPKCTLIVRESSRAAAKSHLLADIVVPIEADLALVTWYPRIYCHSVSHLEPVLGLNVAADGYHEAGALVAL